MPHTEPAWSAHAEAVYVDTLSVMAYGAVGDGTTDDTAAIQAAITANKSVYFPPGGYKVTSTITVTKDRHLLGFGGYLGSRIEVAHDDTIFNCYDTGAGSKRHTRVVIEGLHFFKDSLGSTPATTAYCIDMSEGWMDTVKNCYFGDIGAASCCPPGINISGTAHNIYDCRFLQITEGPAINIQASTIVAGDPTDSASIYIHDTQHEHESRIELTDAVGVHITGAHMEDSKVIFHNARDCSFTDSYFTNGVLILDSKSCGNRIHNISGTYSKMLCNSAENTLDNVVTSSFGPFKVPVIASRETSPTPPVAFGTTYNPTYHYSYNGTEGDTLFFAVTVEKRGVTASSVTDTIKFVDAADGTALHTSPSITLTAGDADVAQYRSNYKHRFTYWQPVLVPASGTVAVITGNEEGTDDYKNALALNVWCSKALNTNAFPGGTGATTDWLAGNPTDGHLVNYVNADPSNAGAGLVYTPSATGWGVSRYFKPLTPARGYLYVLEGLWADDQLMQLKNAPMRDANAGSFGLDSNILHADYAAGDYVYNLQESTPPVATDAKMLMLYVPFDSAMVIPYGVTGRRICFAFGGSSGRFTDTADVTIQWAAVVPIG